jgi:hypothetical protein
VDVVDAPPAFPPTITIAELAAIDVGLDSVAAHVIIDSACSLRLIQKYLGVPTSL